VSGVEPLPACVMVSGVEPLPACVMVSGVEPLPSLSRPSPKALFIYPDISNTITICME
jgi:hypothetical protein